MNAGALSKRRNTFDGRCSTKILFDLHPKSFFEDNHEM